MQQRLAQAREAQARAMQRFAQARARISLAEERLRIARERPQTQEEARTEKAEGANLEADTRATPGAKETDITDRLPVLRESQPTQEPA